MADPALEGINLDGVDLRRMFRALYAAEAATPFGQRFSVRQFMRTWVATGGNVVQSVAAARGLEWEVLAAEMEREEAEAREAAAQQTRITAGWARHAADAALAAQAQQQQQHDSDLSALRSKVQAASDLVSGRITDLLPARHSKWRAEQLSTLCSVLARLSVTGAVLTLSDQGPHIQPHEHDEPERHISRVAEEAEMGRLTTVMAELDALLAKGAAAPPRAVRDKAHQLMSHAYLEHPAAEHSVRQWRHLCFCWGLAHISLAQLARLLADPGQLGGPYVYMTRCDNVSPPCVPMLLRRQLEPSNTAAAFRRTACGPAWQTLVTQAAALAPMAARFGRAAVLLYLQGVEPRIKGALLQPQFSGAAHPSPDMRRQAAASVLSPSGMRSFDVLDDAAQRFQADPPQGPAIFQEVFHAVCAAHPRQIMALIDTLCCRRSGTAVDAVRVQAEAESMLLPGSTFDAATTIAWDLCRGVKHCGEEEAFNTFVDVVRGKVRLFLGNVVAALSGSELVPAEAGRSLGDLDRAVSDLTGELLVQRAWDKQTEQEFIASGAPIPATLEGRLRASMSYDEARAAREVEVLAWQRRSARTAQAPAAGAGSAEEASGAAGAAGEGDALLGLDELSRLESVEGIRAGADRLVTAALAGNLAARAALS